MGALTKTLYDTDFVEWAGQTAELLRLQRFHDVDWEHLIEEIDWLKQSEERAARSQMRRLLLHLIKMRIQPQRAGISWRRSVVDARNELEDMFERSPSLQRHGEENLQKTYRRAVKQALDETDLGSKARQLDVPETCPYTLTELLDGDLNDLVAKG